MSTSPPPQPEPDTKDSDNNTAKAGKQRKVQSEEDFQEQKEQYKNGPLRQTSNWLLEKDFDNCSADKIDRATLKNAAERAYFLGNFEKALDILSHAKSNGWDIASKEMKELDHIREACEDKLQQS